MDALEDVGQGGTGAPDAFVLAVGAPGYDVGGHNDAGWVGFLAATDGGNVASWVTQNTAGIPGAAEAGDRFGAAISINYLSSGSLGLGAAVDAAVGAPNEDVGSVKDAGAVTIVEDVYDIPEHWHRHRPELAGRARESRSAGIGSVGVWTRSRSAARPGWRWGCPVRTSDRMRTPGACSCSPPTPRTSIRVRRWIKTPPGVTDSTESGDTFGDQVAWAAPGLSDTVTRLAVSAPKENGAAADTGVVQVFPINNLGAESTYTQNTAGIPGGAEAGDKFGSKFAVVEGAGERVLLVGVPDDVGNSTGMVDVIPFAGGTPRFWKPGTSGIPAGASRFGDALASVTI